jgi:hypothetical protein
VPASTSDPQTSPRFQAPLPVIATPPSQWLNPDPESPEDHPDPSGLDDITLPTTGSTDRLPGGDPEKVAKVVGGLLVLTIATLSILARRRGREVRQATPRQRDDIAQPVARILVRHLPLDALGPDLVDITEAVVATHEYLLDGPLVTAARPPDVDIDIPEFVNPEEY